MEIASLIQDGSVNPFFLFAVSMLIGALHGLEPGHSKTMIAAYIIAIKGSVFQSFLLGVSAAFSHSIIVWILAVIALTYGNELIGEQLEPWFMIISGLIIISMAFWIARPLLQSYFSKREHLHHSHHHSHHDDHDHDHHHHHHEHDHHHEHGHGSEDAHARAHAAAIEQQLADGRTGNWQTILFGLTGGLLPCPAAITVFIICMHLGKFTLGVLLVGAFSLGLAIMLIAVGVVTALGLKAISARTGFFDKFTSRAPYFSSVLIAVIGLVFVVNGYLLLDGAHAGHSH
ncbi:MAG: nickel/cobalt efflux transporter [Pseudomonadota bacterium]